MIHRPDYFFIIRVIKISIEAVFSRIFDVDTHINIEILELSITIDVNTLIGIVSSQSGNLRSVRQNLAACYRAIDGYEQQQNQQGFEQLNLSLTPEISKKKRFFAKYYLGLAS